MAFGEGLVLYTDSMPEMCENANLLVTLEYGKQSTSPRVRGAP
jgi:hypothetical protein